MKNEVLLRNRITTKYSSKLFWVLALMVLIGGTAFNSSAQTITGKVVSEEDSEGLPGVNVIIKGTTQGTVTDLNGDYQIDVPSNETVLVFSSVGFVSEEIQVAQQSVINVNLIPDLTALEEVVVVGYGSMERSNVTGAITTVDVDEVQKVPVPNAIEALRGQVAGLQVIRTSGQPGSPVTFKIRGNNSLGASSEIGDSQVDEVNQPIIVIDGVPMIDANMSELNTADIESINVLKDAASASIYGSSGANGVVLITTKKGKSGKARVTLNASTGPVDLVQRPDVMNGDQFLKFKFDVFKNGDPNISDPTVSSVLDAVEYENFIAGQEVDWLDEVLRTGMQTNVGATVSGGSELGNFYISGNFYDETGPIEASDFRRYSFRFNGDIRATEWMTVGARVQYSTSMSDQRTRIVGFENDAVPSLSALVGTSPYGNLYDEEGNYSKFATEDLFAVNPLHKFNESEFDVNVERTYVNPYINIDIIDGLTYTLNTFAESRTEFMGRFQSSNFTDDALSLANIRETKSVNYLLDNILGYKKVFGKHGLDITAVYGFQKRNWTQLDTEGRNTAADQLGYWGIRSAPAAQQTIDNNSSDWAKYYIAGRVGYNYAGKYNATFTLRRDASSRFLGDNRFGLFPSAALAWNVEDENWWFGGNTFNMLKIRASYGEMGNDNINPFSYQAGTYPTTIPGTSDTGFRPGTVAGNKDLKWETSKQFNLGLDFGLFSSRVSGSLEIYRTRTEDVLLYQEIQAALNNGYERYPSNIGETENKGIEASLKGVIIENNDFSWTASVNMAANRSTIIRLNQTGANGEPLDDPTNGWFIGEDFQEIYDFKYLGVYTTEQAGSEDLTIFGTPVQPGDPKIQDFNGDGNIDFDDRAFIGNPTPNWYGGINNVLNYKGLTLSVLIEWVDGVTRYNSIYGRYDNARGNTVAIDYWTPENENSKYPRVGESSPMSGAGGAFGEAIFTEDASFVSLRNVSLSYALPKKWLDGIFIEDVSLTASGYNLYYWTDYTNAYSPEITNTDQYPPTRNITFGAKVTF